jgi:tRNA(Ile)-lysidine synthase
VSELVERTARNIRDRRLLRRGDRVVIGVSGGVDSMVLLEILHRLARENRWSLAVAHFNHLLRGKEADEDAKFVLRRAKALGLGRRQKREDIHAAAKRNGVSIEMAAREERHRFLVEAAVQEKASRIALAHHADDQIELFWLRVLRGNAGEGLAGMRWINLSAYAKGKKIYLVRPFLNVAKEEIACFAKEQKIEYRQDSTNELEDYDRNRVRLKVLPLLKEYQPAIRETTSRIVAVLGAEKEWLRSQAAGWLRSRKPVFSKLHLALQREVIVVQLLGAGLVPNYELVERLRVYPGQPFTISPGKTVQMSAEGRVSLATCEEIRISDAQIELNVKSAGAIEWEGAKFSWRKIKAVASRPVFARGKECFDADRVGDLIRLRYWRAGDRFQPIGMGQEVKLQDWFVNQKVPKEQRHEKVIATTKDGEIFWVEGMRIGEKFKTGSATSKVLEWRWRRQC